MAMLYAITTVIELVTISKKELAAQNSRDFQARYILQYVSIKTLSRVAVITAYYCLATYRTTVELRSNLCPNYF